MYSFKKKYQNWTITDKSVENNKKLVKYFKKRLSLFSRLYKGVIFDDESWYSVTDENLARLIVYKFTKSIPKEMEIFVGFCGIGGDTIHFCAAGYYVIANDISYQKLKYLRINHKVYGVFNYKTLLFDFFELPVQKNRVGFLTPPWGGIDYRKKNRIGYESDINFFNRVITKAMLIFESFAIYLPRHIDITVFIDLKFEKIVKNDIHYGFIGYYGKYFEN
ncbi:Trimethylguanosine synthase [Dictyocoela muelleri]|nr:Trimethylguanosine synthase [Dictyocoela muelleri]